MAKLRYDQMEVPANQLREQRQTGEESTSGKTDMMKEIQRMVSAARRADGKVRRLHEAKAKREAQWVLFEKKSRADFLEQKRLYENDVRRILDEIEEATQQGVIASAEAQDLAAHGFRPKPQAMSVEEPDAWDSLIHDEANQEQGFLGEALRAARQASAATPQHPARSDGSMAGPAEAARLLAATLAALPPGADFGQLGFPQATPGPSHPAGFFGPPPGLMTAPIPVAAGPPDGTTPGAVPHHQSEATEVAGHRRILRPLTQMSSQLGRILWRVLCAHPRLLTLAREIPLRPEFRRQQSSLDQPSRRPRRRRLLGEI